MATILISGTIMAATGKIKIIVNGTEVSTDVAPKNENGRVLVPISTISTALGAKVKWDAKANSVIIEGNTSKSAVWPGEDKSHLSSDWMNYRDLITQYISLYNSKGGDYNKLVTKTFKSDFVSAKEIVPKTQEPIIDYQFLDAKFNGTLDDVTRNKIRVEVVKYSDLEKRPNKLIKLQLDFDVRYTDGKYLIDGIWVKGKEEIKSYTLFSGLTYKEVE